MDNVHKVLDVKFLTDTVYKLIIEKKDINFEAGQHFSIGIPNQSINREYSIYNSPNEQSLEFLIKKMDNGILSKELCEIKDREIILLGPYSDFIIPNEAHNKKFLFIGTGTGIAPFASFVKTYNNLEYKLLFGTRYKDEVYDLNLYKNIEVCPSRDDKKIHVQDKLNNLDVNEFHYIYLCGNSKMIVDVQNILEKKGYNGIVKSEVFF